MTESDELDRKEPGWQAWIEFRAAFAAGRLQSWLTAGLSEIAPEFFDSIEKRFDQAQWDAEDREAADARQDWAEVELPGGVLWVADREAIAEVRTQLLPHRDSSESFPYRARCLALVAMDSALEAYCSALGIKTSGQLPSHIRDWLSSSHPLSESDYRRLQECNQLRHLIVHRRGIVDMCFVHKVPWTSLHVGERHPLSDRELWDLGSHFWYIASLIRSAADSRPRAV